MGWLCNARIFTISYSYRILTANDAKQAKQCFKKHFPKTNFLINAFVPGFLVFLLGSA